MIPAGDDRGPASALPARSRSGHDAPGGGARAAGPGFRGGVLDPPRPAPEIVLRAHDGTDFRLSRHRGDVGRPAAELRSGPAGARGDLSCTVQGAGDLRFRLLRPRRGPAHHRRGARAGARLAAAPVAGRRGAGRLTAPTRAAPRMRSGPRPGPASCGRQARAARTRDAPGGAAGRPA
jgi:hypothetical protein